jgi:hypothetical protein
MEFTQGKLNGLVKILNRTYPFIVGVDYEGHGEELYKNGMDIVTFIADLIEAIFFSPDDDRNIIQVYFKANI